VSSLKEVYETIIETVDIVEVARKYVDLKKVGSNYSALSPFKNETVPSFFVSPSKKIFKCFSSGHGGNVIKLVSLLEGVSYLEAAKKLALEYNIPVEIEEDDKYYEILRDACIYYNKQLHQNKKAVLYLKKRGVYELADEFLLGYCPQDNTELYSILVKKYTAEDINNTGLFVRLENKVKNFFDNRIIIPVFDFYGRIFNIQARAVSDLEKTKKYIFMRANRYNTEKKEVYNLNKAKEYIKQKEEAIITEGVFEVFALYKAGHKNTVSFLGVNYKHEQVQKIKRLTDTVFLIFDPDTTGINTIIKFAEQYANEFIIYTYEFQNTQEDIDALLHKNKQLNIEDNKILISSFIRKKYEAAQTPKEKIKYKKTFENIINSISNKDIKVFYEEDYKIINNNHIKKVFLMSNIENVKNIIRSRNKEKIRNTIMNDEDYCFFLFLIKNYDLKINNEPLSKFFSELLCGYNFKDKIKNSLKDLICFSFFTKLPIEKSLHYFEDESLSELVIELILLAETGPDILDDFSIEDFFRYITSKRDELNNKIEQFIIIADSVTLR